MDNRPHVGTWLVGSIAHSPDEDHRHTAQVVDRQLEWTPDARNICGGELANRQDLPWVADLCQQIACSTMLEVFDNPKLPTPVRRLTAALGRRALGRGQRYQDYVIRTLAGTILRRNARQAAMKGHLPEFPYARQAADDMAAIREGTDHGELLPPFMAGIPTALALRLFSGFTGAFPEIDERLVQEAQRIVADNPEAIIQIELPVETLLAMVWLPRAQHYKLLARAMDPVRQLITGLPAGSRIAFHLCWGDLQGKKIVPPVFRSNRGKVRLINAITDMDIWRAYELVAIHDPAGNTKPLALRAYHDLKPLPPGTIYAIGVLEPDIGQATLASRYTRMRRATRHAVRRTAIAYSCGTGRLSLDEAAEMYRSAAVTLTAMFPEQNTTEIRH